MLTCVTQSQTLDGGFGKKSFKEALKNARALGRVVPKRGMAAVTVKRQLGWFSAGLGQCSPARQGLAGR